ncbi:YesL family protein [Ileibacterium valens]|uniref:DUF624 domain-containing protein n=1 Tax=Ileibacterium valens TaxID=1862668 RepID=A0A1U7NED3_9FIRM|nr:DUF624 domain-containing protein [Ileibacterium valens]OLU36127.1 hypothetical protein BM735_12965 [Erysipelotrichaceae bacterium NYU-BL-F16]OLU37916.1 hypothetical protein BO222_09395 [Ileibacterium valens]OLU41004.1 hypothetical protein BO224_04500 [Erysipelotrichaceae bacterium NYU-BL-E8]
MNALFNLENPVFAWIEKAVESAYLNILWFFCSLPIFTIGASTTALFTVLLKMSRDEESNITKMFFAAFKSNFKQSTQAWLIMLTVLVILVLDGYVTYHLQPESIFWTMISSFLIVTAALWLFVMVYLFPLMAYFENSLLQTFKNSIVVSLRYLLCTLLVLAIHALMLYITVFLFTPAIVFGFGFASFMSCYLLRNVFEAIKTGDLAFSQYRKSTEKINEQKQ